MQEKLIYPLTQINISVQLHNDAYCLRSGENNPSYRYSVEKCVLNLKKYKLVPSIHSRLEDQLAKSAATYNLNVWSSRHYLIQPGSTEFNCPDIFQGNFLPQMAIIAMTDQASNQGLYTTSPHNWRPFHCTDVRFICDGYVLPSRPFDCRFDAGVNTDHSRVYKAIFRSISQWSQSHSGAVDLTRLDQGHCYFVINFDESDGSCRQTLSPKRLSPATLSVTFSVDNNPAIKLFLFTLTSQEVSGCFFCMTVVQKCLKGA